MGGCLLGRFLRNGRPAEGRRGAGEDVVAGLGVRRRHHEGLLDRSSAPARGSRGRIEGAGKQLTQSLPSPVQVDADGGDRHGQLLGDLLVTEVLQAMQAKDLGLPRRDPGQRGAQPIGELGLFEVPGCWRGGGLDRVPIRDMPARPSSALAEAVHGAGCRQAPKQRAPVPHSDRRATAGHPGTPPGGTRRRRPGCP